MKRLNYILLVALVIGNKNLFGMNALIKKQDQIKQENFKPPVTLPPVATVSEEEGRAAATTVLPAPPLPIKEDKLPPLAAVSEEEGRAAAATVLPQPPLPIKEDKLPPLAAVSEAEGRAAAATVLPPPPSPIEEDLSKIKLAPPPPPQSAKPPVPTRPTPSPSAIPSQPSPPLQDYNRPNLTSEIQAKALQIANKPSTNIDEQVEKQKAAKQATPTDPRQQLLAGIKAKAQQVQQGREGTDIESKINIQKPDIANVDEGDMQSILKSRFSGIRKGTSGEPKELTELRARFATAKRTGRKQEINAIRSAAEAALTSAKESGWGEEEDTKPYEEFIEEIDSYLKPNK